MMNTYDPISRYYDQSQAGMVDDIPFLLSLAAETGGPILELGCGSGRLLLPLTRAGHAVTGVDSSPAMLALAEARLAEEDEAVRDRVRLILGDITNSYLPDESHSMALVLVGINTFMHLDESAAQSALREAARLLQPNGRLVIDVDNPFALAEVGSEGALEFEQRWLDSGSGNEIRQLGAYKTVEVEQAVDVTWVFEEHRSDKTISQARVEMRYHYLYPHQFDLLLTRNGLQLTALYGDYAGGPFDEDSDRLVVMATRR